MKGVILAAGKGTRMRPITYEIPKVMLPVGGVPVFIRNVRLMRKHILKKRDKILYNCYKKPLFDDIDHKRFGLMPFVESKLWGSAGAIKRMQKELNDTFVLIYGDVLSETNLSSMYQFHQKHGGIATMGVTRVPNPEQKGIVEIDKWGLVSDFEEKPEHPKSDLANSAVFFFEPDILKYIPRGKFYDISKDLIPDIIYREHVYAYRIKEYLIDIGDFESYEKAIMRYRKNVRR